MKIIKAFSGETILIDDEDYEFLSQYSWHRSSKKSDYFIRAYISKKQKHVAISRLLMKPPKNRVVDHIDGNTLNNQKKNLRVCSINENCLNKKIAKNNKTGFTGIFITKGRWIYYVSYIKIQDKTIKKYFKTFQEAIDFRQSLEKKYFGEFARKTTPQSEGRI